MAEIDAEEAARCLSDLLQRAISGEEIVITRAGGPVARLVPVEPKPQRVLGQDEGLFKVPEDFDAPLPPEVLASFER
jgi:prevent-host-death family protein